MLYVLHTLNIEKILLLINSLRLYKIKSLKNNSFSIDYSHSLVLYLGKTKKLLADIIPHPLRPS